MPSHHGKAFTCPCPPLRSGHYFPLGNSWLSTILNEYQSRLFFVGSLSCSLNVGPAKECGHEPVGSDR